MTFHQGLTPERWQSFPLDRCVLMIGSELKRLEQWLERGDREAAEQCVERALELLDLSVATARPGPQRREFCRAREVLRGVLVSSEPLSDARVLTRTLIGDL